jgi:D-3-phosphoglycerate dehydrogenase
VSSAAARGAGLEGAGGLVLVTSRSWSSGSRDLEGELTSAGYRVARAAPVHDLDELRPLLRDAVGWIAGTGPVTREVLEAAPRLRVIARYGVGVDAVDLAAAADRGIVVTNTPGANSSAVADLAVALMLTALRGIPAADRRVRAGDWSGRQGRELGALTVGIVGLGRIGRGVAERLTGFGATLLGADPFVPADDPVFTRVRRVGLDELARDSDVVTLHAPGGEQTLVDAAWFARATRPQLIVNTARADLVDETAVAAALRSSGCLGYAADTLAIENHGEHASPLLAPDLADRVIVTPHLGAQTLEGIDGMGSMATENLLAVLRGDAPGNPVEVAA